MTRANHLKSQPTKSSRSIRLQKFLSEAGVTSRRKAEELITAGKIKVNGTTVRELGSRVDPELDAVTVDGKRVQLEEKFLYLFHKPTKVITSLSDPRGRPTIADYTADMPVRLFPVGRLDFDVSGLLLLTNDGDLADRLLHPRHKTERVYWAVVSGELSKDKFTVLKKGVALDDGEGRLVSARELKDSPAVRRILREIQPGQAAVEVSAEEGRNHFIKRMLAAVELPVLRLVRVQFGPYKLGNLRPGELRRV